MVRVSPGPALLRRRIEIIKEHVGCVEVAQEALGERGEKSLRKAGDRWRGTCPICGNGGHSDAFSCDSALFHCFACDAGGDVITLAQLANSFNSVGMATAWLGHRYGVELPERPEGWWSKQDRQARLREQIEEKKRNTKRRRLFKIIMVPILNATGADEEEVKAAWQDFRNLPV